MNKAYMQKRVSYIELLSSSVAALPAVSIELASIKSTQRQSATINEVINCNPRLSILYMAGGCTMLSSERSDWVRWGPVGSDWVRCGSIGSGGVISHTEDQSAAKHTFCIRYNGQSKHRRNARRTRQLI